MKKQKYTEEQIREILTIAYPGKSAIEIEEMVKETMAQYVAEEKSRRKNPTQKNNSSST